MISSGSLAASLGLKLKGDPDLSLTGAALLEDAGPDQLAFAAHPRFFAAARESAAGCVIAPPEYAQEAPPSQTVIESPQPRAHFAQALALLYPAPELQSGIDCASVAHDAHVDPSAEVAPFARIEAGAIVGPNTRVGAGCFIGAGVHIGADCTLHPRATIYPRVTLGSRCVIHSGAVLGADGFGFELMAGSYRKVPQVGTVEIGDDVEIGANTCIDRATLGVTRIGDGTKLDNMVHIAHNCELGRHVVIAAQTGLAGGVKIGDYAVIGGQVGIGDKARIEPHAIVGSGAGILTSKIVRAGEPVWGTPARPLRQYLRQLAALARLAKRD